MALLPFASVTLKALKPKESDFEPGTVGEHIRKRRLMLGITRRDAAEALKVTATTLLNWELGKRQPRIQYIPAVVEFLGYDPLPQPQAIPERLRQKRRQMGWGQWELAEHLGVDRSTVTAWEGGGTIMAKAHRRLIAHFLDLPEAEFDSEMRDRWIDSHNRRMSLCGPTEQA